MRGVWEGRTAPASALSLVALAAVFARRCFRSLPPIEILEQATFRPGLSYALHAGFDVECLFSMIINTSESHCQ